MTVGALLVRNEADRYLRRTLENVASLVDKIVVVDDGSTDDTIAICREFGEVHTRDGDGFWEHDESVARSLLWRLAAEAAGPDGWIYVSDADHLLEGITPRDFRTLTRSAVANAWAFPLLDCWNGDEQHRIDGYWVAWRTPRVWLAKAMPAPQFMPSWDTEGLHVGHLPSNYPLISGIAPAYIRHLGYCEPADRERKRERYLQRA